MSGALYERDGVWDAPLQPGQRWLARAAADLWPAGVATALDAGGGDGKVARAIAAATGVRVVAVDGSPAAARRAGGVRGLVSALPVRTGAVDAALCLDVLEHLEAADEARAWSELFRVARTAVLVAVPFEEHLSEATATCAGCGTDYHLNWHRRRYDAAALLARVPPGWRAAAVVLTGEPWSQASPLETDLRRTLLGERAGWVEAVCPACGHVGAEPVPGGRLPPALAVALAERVYALAARRPASRAHSELLVLWTREGAAGVVSELPGARARRASAACLELEPAVMDADLIGCPQVARLVRGVDGAWVAQLPAYGPDPSLMVERASGPASVELLVEDGLGHLRLSAPLGRSRPALPRALRPGAYGVLVRFAPTDGLARLALEHARAPDVTWAEPEGGPVGYLRVRDDPPAWAQVTGRTWLGPDELDGAAAPRHAWREVVHDALAVERGLREEALAARDHARARLAAMEAHFLRLGAVGRRLVDFLTRGAAAAPGAGRRAPGASSPPPPS